MGNEATSERVFQTQREPKPNEAWRVTMMLKKLLDFLFGHSWVRVPFDEPERGEPEWSRVHRYGGDLVSLGGLAIRRRCRWCSLVQRQTGRVWHKNGGFSAQWEDETS